MRGASQGVASGDDLGQPVGGHGHRDRADDVRRDDRDGDTDGTDGVLLAVQREVPVGGEVTQQAAAVGDRVLGQVLQLVAGQVVLAVGLGEAGEYRLAEGAGVRRVVEADVGFRTRWAGACARVRSAV